MTTPAGDSTTALDRFLPYGSERALAAGERLFSEGDRAEHLYLVLAGSIVISVQRFSSRKEIGRLGPGSWFGEVAALFGERRTAGAEAREPARLLAIPRGRLPELMEREPEFAAKVNELAQMRAKEVVLREKLLASAGLESGCLHIGIKGDPSLRESAFSRERYESAVDRVLPQLAPVLEELLLRRDVFEAFIGFNNGEIRLRTLLDPFTQEEHAAERLIDPTYVARHFPPIDYPRKAAIVRTLHAVVRADPFFATLPGYLANATGEFYDRWQPTPPEGLAGLLARLGVLRAIPNLYLRNCTLSTVQHSIHMQFNCDGTHIVGIGDIERFLEENL